MKKHFSKFDKKSSGQKLYANLFQIAWEKKRFKFTTRRRVKKEIFSDATKLDYSTIPMLSQTSARKPQCISKYLFPWKFLNGIQQSGLISEMMIQKIL